MNDDYLALLKEESANLESAAKALDYSRDKCVPLLEKNSHSLNELEHIEALTSRFSRLCDILIQKIFRLIDEIELENEGTVRDRINRAEKRGVINSAQQFIEIRRLRNKISHEYDPDAVGKLLQKTFDFSIILLESVTKTRDFCKSRYGL